MSNKVVAKPGHVWVWTEKAEKHARANFKDSPHQLDRRIAGTPATMGTERLNDVAPRVWAEKGYIEEQCQDVMVRDDLDIRSLDDAEIYPPHPDLNRPFTRRCST